MRRDNILAQYIAVPYSKKFIEIKRIALVGKEMNHPT